MSKIPYCSCGGVGRKPGAKDVRENPEKLADFLERSFRQQVLEIIVQ
jgi:hypothetical protein